MSKRDRVSRRPTPGARPGVSHWLRVTLTLETAGRSRLIRSATLVALIAIVFAISGVVRGFSPMRWVGSSPFDLDLALRTLSAGWFAPRQVIPVTIVEIDEATHRAWGSPAITPRASLMALIDIVTRAAPAAVVVDIDLSWGGEDPGLPALREYLAGYSGAAPLVFPKRIDAGPGGTRQAASSRLDEIFDRNSRLAWAHASFESSSGGVVRQWADWIEVCAPDGTHLLPSVPARLSLLLDPQPPGWIRSTPPPLSGTCRRADDPPGQLLLIGPRMTGPGSAGITADTATVSALSVLDPDVAREDSQLFAGRVVLIGATHPSAGDLWLTPSGVLPGVEMIAHTVRFAALRTAAGWRADLALRTAVLSAFLVFAAISVFLRGLAAAVAYLFGGLLFVALPIALWDYYRVFEALETAVLLFVLYKFLQTALDMVEEWKEVRTTQPPGWPGRLRSVWAVCRKRHSGGRDS